MAFGGGGCGEEAAGTGEIGLQTRSPPSPRQPGLELGVAGPSQASLPRSWGAHESLSYLRNRARCAKHLDVLRSLSGFRLLVL